MPITAASNIASLRAQSDLTFTSKALSETFQRLSSGLRINNASDDPAGLALANDLNSDARIAAVAIRNTNDGISLVSVADEALGAVYDVLTRMYELSQQSSNGVYTNTQRSALSTEFVALGSEVERIAATTTFNGFNLLSNSQSISVQVGLDGTANSRITIGSVLATLNSLGLGPTSGALTYSIIGTTSTASQLAATNALSAIQTAIDNLGVTRGLVGAYESRLNVAVNYLTVARENYVAAEQRIRDVDVAQEVATMVRLQILQQSETAVLAQANQQPALVLKLLS